MHALAQAVATELDELTLRRAQLGDERAWRDLIAMYQDRVHALVWRLLVGRTQHRAQDLAQETFVRVLRALPDWNPHGPAKTSTWILTIATRLALNELRRPIPGELPDDPISDDRPDRLTERKQLAAAIARGVAALDDDHRAVLVLREYHGLDYPEIAAVLETPLGTVKSRLSRARAELRTFLAEHRP